MIGRASIDTRVREWGLRHDVVEKDYALGWLLWAIGSDPLLSQYWVFKGGTCLKKCYLETWRFSEDLDFTITPRGPWQPADLAPIFERLLRLANAASGIDFGARAPRFRQRPTGQNTEGRVYYRGPLGSPQPASIKLDLGADETVVRSTVLRPITHPHDDELPGPATVRCYGFEEVFAEKLRALAERMRPRDLYDVVNLFRRRDLRAEPALIREVLEAKCRAKSLIYPTLAELEASPFKPQLESEWASMLDHQLPALPAISSFWDELPDLLAWLDGSLVDAELEQLGIGEDNDLSWRPPATVWTWGGGVPFEPIRFAGANHLCVELDYDGRSRVIEPYSLRRTRAGHLLLHAIRADSRAHRAYRVDRIQGVRVTSRAFRPVYAVEFAAMGPLSAPPSPRPARAFPRFGSTHPGYRIRCRMCGKIFRRTRPGSTIGRHKRPDGRACPGRAGFSV